MMLSNTDMKYIMQAANEAYKSPVLMRHGSVAVANGKIRGRGYNHYRSYSKDAFINNCCTCHAECDVLHKLLKIRNLRRNNITMYIVRIGQGGELRESAPCHHCHEKMLFFGIKTLIYSKEVRPISIDGQHNVVANQTDKNIMFVKCPTASFTPTVVTTGQKWITKSLKYQEDEID